VALALALDALLVSVLIYLADLVWGRPDLERPAVLAAWVGLVALTVALILRALASGHWPLTNRFEFALTFAWATLAVFLLLERSGHPGILGVFVVPIPAGLVAYAMLVLSPAEQTIRPLAPALNSNWLEIHVVSAALGYGAGAIAAALAVLCLILIRQPSGAGLPSSQAVESAMDRAIELAFPLLSVALLAGAIWAQNTWGRYWDWDPKESWALVTWLVYLVYLHGRGARGWRGRRLAWVSLIGFGCILLTFLGVNWLVAATGLQSLHVFR
jgi:cytochrome c-type biogenesis protein CcsB